MTTMAPMIIRMLYPRMVTSAGSRRRCLPPRPSLDFRHSGHAGAPRWSRCLQERRLPGGDDTCRSFFAVVRVTMPTKVAALLYLDLVA